MEYAKCIECGETKAASEFYVQSGWFSLRRRCKKCYCKKLYQQGINRLHLEVVEKSCSICGETKPASAFRKKKSAIDGLATFCNECRNVKERAKYKEHPERQAKRSARWIARHPEEHEAHWIYANHRRRCAVDNGVKMTAKDFRAIRERSAGFCPYCCRPLLGLKRHYDHHFPTILGGETSVENFVYCCSECNESKGVKVGLAYAKWLRERGGAHCSQ